MSRTQLADLDLPRDPSGQAVVAEVEVYNWRDKKDIVDLFDARSCPPTKATGKQLESAAARGKDKRTCQRCGARCQRSLSAGPETVSSTPEKVESRLLCPTCRFVLKLLGKQEELAAARSEHAVWAIEVLARERLAVLWVDDVVPEPTPSGKARPMTATRLRACDGDGKQILDVLVRLVKPRAKFVPEGAVAVEDAVPLVHTALLGRPLLVWNEEAFARLRQVAPHEMLPFPANRYSMSYAEQERRQALGHAVAGGRVRQWRGQLDPKTLELVPCVPAGTPDRLLYLLRRMAASIDVTAADGALVEDVMAADEVLAEEEVSTGP
ncbi:hypothetical protein [Lentzea albidocapillata]|nr:hypothetical protein [Lentzea albidocapillata]